jgi:hypothetical protein
MNNALHVKLLVLLVLVPNAFSGALHMHPHVCGMYGVRMEPILKRDVLCVYERAHLHHGFTCG